MKNILLISGGLDSMVLYENYKDEIDEFVYIKYRGEHPATLRELEVIEKAGIKPKILEMPFSKNLEENQDGFYEGRNLKFLLTIREHFKNEDLTVLVGNTANDFFSDNTKIFFTQVESVINSSYNGTLRIVSPLESRTKKSLIKEAQKKGIDFYFCDTGGKAPCLKCHSCRAMVDAGYKIEAMEGKNV